MSAPCLGCAHPQRQDLDAALRAGESVRTLAERFGVSKSSVSRHRTHVGQAAATVPLDPAVPVDGMPPPEASAGSTETPVAPSAGARASEAPETGRDRHVQKGGDRRVRERLLVQALLEGRTIEAAAAAVGLSVRGAYRWLARPRVKAEYARAYDALSAKIDLGLGRLAEDAADVHRDLMAKEEEGGEARDRVRLRAAQSALAGHQRARERLVKDQSRSATAMPSVFILPPGTRVKITTDSSIAAPRIELPPGEVVDAEVAIPTEETR